MTPGVCGFVPSLPGFCCSLAKPAAVTCRRATQAARGHRSRCVLARGLGASGLPAGVSGGFSFPRRSWLSLVLGGLSLYLCAFSVPPILGRPRVNYDVCWKEAVTGHARGTRFRRSGRRTNLPVLGEPERGPQPFRPPRE